MVTKTRLSSVEQVHLQYPAPEELVEYAALHQTHWSLLTPFIPENVIEDYELICIIFKKKISRSIHILIYKTLASVSVCMFVRQSH